LTTGEFDEIRSHVSHTFRFLSQIPWESVSSVPIIAGAHHERLNGTGYPNRWHAEEIPVQSKLMAVADIYDALTASDRPYKKAVPWNARSTFSSSASKTGTLTANWSASSARLECGSRSRNSPRRSHVVARAGYRALVNRFFRIFGGRLRDLER